MLLILAGVTINLVLADGGIFKKAKAAAEAQEMATIRDYTALAQGELIIENASPSNKYDRSETAVESLAMQIMKANFPKNMTITEDSANPLQIQNGKYSSGSFVVKVNSTGNEYKVTLIDGEIKVEKVGEGSSNSGDLDDEEPESGITVPVTGVTINPTTASIKVGETFELTATVEPNSATNKNVKCSLNKEGVVTISSNSGTAGAPITVTAIGEGEVIITVESEENKTKKNTCTVKVENKTVSDLGTTPSDKNTYTTDKYGNKIVVPAGFIVVPHGTDNVEYTFDKEDGNSTNIPVVQDGIVIKDATVDEEGNPTDTNGNQFVWVPVGEIKNDAVENTQNKTTIKLGRYEDFTMDTSTNTPTPPNPKQLAENWAINDNTTLISSYYQEYAQNNSYPNTKALDLEGWILTSLENKGYYIARYEASKEGEKAASKISTGRIVSGNSDAINNGMLWTNITQSNAAIAAKATYPKSTDKNAIDNYYSDLINSYAWDTAIIFIQTYSGNTTYASQILTSSSANTGTTTDKVCNIYEIASNMKEWTTETTVQSRDAYIYRGGYTEAQTTCASTRNGRPNRVHYRISFRTSLYVSSNVE